MSETILVVDDEEAARALGRDTLALEGFTVLDTGDPQHALRLARQQPIQLLVTDVVAPLMKGTELAKHVQSVSGAIRSVRRRSRLHPPA
jgi:two-component system, cell cycle sensor histidine kinase and response regulator CckA